MKSALIVGGSLSKNGECPECAGLLVLDLEHDIDVTTAEKLQKSAKLLLIQISGMGTGAESFILRAEIEHRQAMVGPCLAGSIDRLLDRFPGIEN